MFKDSFYAAQYSHPFSFKKNPLVEYCVGKLSNSEGNIGDARTDSAGTV
jgi:hypothetical protein